MGWVIYAGEIDKLEGKPPYRDGGCVALVQAVTGVGHTGTWRPGPRVVDLAYLNPGTVIANFKFDAKGVGRFPNEHGYDAALFKAFGSRSMSTSRPARFWCVDQFVNRIPKNRVGEREIIARGDRSRAKGNPFYDADNADQFYVVEVL